MFVAEAVSKLVIFDESAATGFLNPIVPPGAVVEVLIAVTKTVSAPPTEVKLKSIVTEAVSVVFTEVLTAVAVIVEPTWMTALEGPDARTPNPRAATTASATRLKVVLLDICFLSIVVTETFSVAALR